MAEYTEPGAKLSEFRQISPETVGIEPIPGCDQGSGTLFSKLAYRSSTSHDAGAGTGEMHMSFG
jgi:hypothetical protein